MISSGKMLTGVALAVTALSALTVTAAGQATLTNPIAPTGNDPWIVRDGGLYYYCYYSWRGRICVNWARTIQEAVQFTGTAVWRPERGQAYSRELWAPELHTHRQV
jgi:GH43 family beta-xylosidase